MGEMDKLNESGPSEDRIQLLLDRFELQEHQVRLVNARRGAVLAIIFVMGGLTMDWVVYKELFEELLILRVACCCMLGGVLALLYVQTLKRFVPLLIHMIALLPLLALDWVLVQIEVNSELLGPEGRSPGDGRYYAGLNLNMVGAVLILRWRFRDGVINAALCIGGYLAVAMALDFTFLNTLTSVFFLSVTGAFACVGLFYYNRLRFAEYCLREDIVIAKDELDVKNQQLGAALTERDVALKEIKENEATLLQAKTLEALGWMCAGIVHHVNNKMNYVKAALAVLRVHADDVAKDEQEDYKDTVADAEGGVNETISIVTDLKSFTQIDGATTEVNLAGTLERARSMLARELERANIEFHVDVPADQSVKGNGNQLCQVFMLLIRNSTQALEGARERGVEPKVEVRSETTADGKVCIRIRDNGTGIEAKNCSQVFTPFFSTHDEGEGMGLGLSICHHTVKSHMGTIAVESKPGLFTEFTITLPPAWPAFPDEDDDDDRGGFTSDASGS